MSETSSAAPVTRYVGIQGNPVDGFLYYGPFITFEEAEEWMSENDPESAESWWISELYGPL